jgi:hypothetical protein
MNFDQRLNNSDLGLSAHPLAGQLTEQIRGLADAISASPLPPSAVERCHDALIALATGDLGQEFARL